MSGVACGLFTWAGALPVTQPDASDLVPQPVAALAFAQPVPFTHAVTVTDGGGVVSG
ncbi:hypothetical protein [Tessaracoccus defluvii]|uniref:Uncharacterized protein n=1 Tax=Tessaracoccus defluvii TaxID=1285901 RepID=A0A7H0H687_9ACTN|nr:hypothetical protein [Tessaracoccus defluvii]QNP56053.1 hypothetical protein H9L22_00500 [Tessaracoccus defluvii]